MQPNHTQDETAFLDKRVAAQKQGLALGICSICSSNPYVLRAAMQQALDSSSPLLIESTSNQVNQYGGYTGVNPAQFYQTLHSLARESGLDSAGLILGGDHLGPNPWQKEPAEAAMAKATQLVSDCVRAGYTKIHLDASMGLGGDPVSGPGVKASAARAADLCRAGEAAWREMGRHTPAPRYIIGTEVPLPGGEVGNAAEVTVTSVESARETLEVTRAAFRKAGLEEAWERVIGLVVQPGVEFGDRTVHPYQPGKAADLAHFITGIPRIVFEAHSTDYQSSQALAALVRDHFAILKVGPALTFAFREAVFALEHIEIELMIRQPSEQRSHLQDAIEQEMLAHPEDWLRYYPGSAEDQRLMRRYSLSDRIRYYWPRPTVQAALAHLIQNLKKRSLPPGLVGQYFPDGSAFYGDPPTPEDLIYRHIRQVLDGYWIACDPKLGK